MSDYQREVRAGDEDYTALYDKWNAEGRPGQFERWTGSAGELWLAYWPDGEVVFVLRAAAPGTDATLEKPCRGYIAEMAQQGLVIKRRASGKFKISMESPVRRE